MPTRGLIDRQRIGKDLLHAARTHAPQVGERLNRDLQGVVGEGETLVDFIDLQQHLARYLELRLEALEAADHAHLQELDDDREPRILREAATSALYGKVVEVRELLRGVYGVERANALVGIDGPTSLDPLTLYDQAAGAVERLREPDPALPPQRLESLNLDRTGLAGELEPLVAELGAILEDIQREKRLREATKERRDRALSAFDTAAGAVARIVIGCDLLAGFPSFAEKVRLTLPPRGGRNGGTGEEDEELPQGPPPQEDPGSEQSATAAGATEVQPDAGAAQPGDADRLTVDVPLRGFASGQGEPST